MAGVKGRSGRKPKWDDNAIEEAAASLLDWLEADRENHIWFRDWAVENNLPPEYLSRWAQKNPVFRQAMTQAEMAQESRLVNGGLRGKLNSRICALVLQSKHSWSDRHTVVAGEENRERPIPTDPEELDAEIARLQEARDRQRRLLAAAEAAGSAVVGDKKCRSQAGKS